MNMAFNVRNVVELLAEEYKNIEKTNVTPEEIRIKDVIKGLYI